MNAESLDQTFARDKGIVWRTLVPGDLPGLVNLLERIEGVDNPPYRTTEGDIRSWLSDTSVWRGVVAVADQARSTERLVAFGLVAVFRSFPGECLLNGGVDPAYRGAGLGGSVIGWQTREGRALYSENFPETEGRLIANLNPDQQPLEEHLLRHGYVWTRTDHELRRELKSLPEMPDIGSYHEIVPWTPELDDQAWRMYNELLERDQHLHHSRKEWLEQRESFVPQWSFIALSNTGDRPKVKGFIIVAGYEQDWKVLGWKEGYIDRLGVTDGSPTTELSRALVSESMNAQIAAGMD